VKKGAFSGSGSSDDSDLFPRLRVEREVSKGERKVIAVAEVDVLELNDPLRRPGVNVIKLFLFIANDEAK